MSEIKTGGPAFPDGSTNEWGNAYNSGMTMRDYFAAKAVQSMNSREDYMDASATVIALDAYALADAMIYARDKK